MPASGPGSFRWVIAVPIDHMDGGACLQLFVRTFGRPSRGTTGARAGVSSVDVDAPKSSLLMAGGAGADTARPSSSRLHFETISSGTLFGDSAPRERACRHDFARDIHDTPDVRVPRLSGACLFSVKAEITLFLDH